MEAQREDLVIKTTYTSIETCRSSAVDVVGSATIAKSWSSKLYGDFTENNHFRITSDAKGASMFVFEGTLVEEEGHVLMKGAIEVRPLVKKMVYLSVVFGLVFGLGLITTFNPVLFFMGLMFMGVPWINLRYMKKSNALYQMVVKKVQ